MRIYIYQPRCSYYVGGGEVVPLEQAGFLNKLGYDVTLITTNVPTMQKSNLFKRFIQENKTVNIEYINIEPELFKIYDIRPGMNQFRWDLESLYVGLLARDLIKSLIGKEDICAVHYVTDLIGVPYNANYVLHLHGYPENLSYLDKLVTYNRKNLLAVSNLISEKWKNMLKESNGEYAIEVIYNGIDTSRFYPKPVRKKYDAGYIGRLIEIKGIQYIIEAIKILRDEHAFKMSFAIAGTGPYENELKALVKKYDLKDSITFLGYLSDENLNDFYNSLYFTVLPSYRREGVLTTLLESSACGIPAISTLGTSMAEFINNNENGILVKPEHSRELARAIKKLKYDEKERLKLGQNAYSTVKQNWQWESQAERLSRFYNKVVNENVYE